MLCILQVEAMKTVEPHCKQVIQMHSMLDFYGQSNALNRKHGQNLFFRACRSPERTVYLAFGHDEEVGGDFGAGAIAALLKSRGVTLDMVLDEGGPIITDGLPALLRTPTQIALVGTAEKVGFLTSEHLCQA